MGGGVIGCAIAERLARERHQVTLCERDRVGSHASGAAAGLLAPYSESDRPGGFFDLALRSYRLFPDLERRLRLESGVDVEYREGESLTLAFSPDDEQRIRRLVAWQSPDLGARCLDREECRRRQPELGPEVRGAALLPQGQVSPPRLVRALAWAAARAGASIREGAPVLALSGSGDRVEGVRVSGEQLAADWVVVAAGPWSPGVTLSLGLELDVLPRRGQLIALAPGGPGLTRILTWGHHYLVPKPDGTLIAGSTEEETGFQSDPTAAGVAGLLQAARRAVPGLDRAVLKGVWAALRPATPSGLPVIGPSATHANLVVATGHHRNGILLAPVTADIVARGLAGNWQPISD